MYDVIEVIIVVVVTAFEILMTLTFFNAGYGKDNIRVNKWVMLVIYILVFTFDVIISQFDVPSIFNVLKSCLLFFALSMMYDTKWHTRLFVVISYLVFGMVSELLSYGVISLALKNISEDSQGDYSGILSKLIVFLMVTICIGFMRKRSLVLNTRDSLRLIVTPLISIATLLMITGGLDNGEPTTTIWICMSGGGFMAINLVVYYLLDDLIETEIIKKRQKDLEQQFAFQEDKYIQTSGTFKKIYGLIHDMNNHLIYLDSCVDRGEYSAAKTYIQKALNENKSVYRCITTGYLPVDALVSNAINNGANDNIKFKTDIRIDKDAITVERYDLCVALGNILDNAIEACRKVENPEDRMISISIITADDRLFINIENAAVRMVDSNFKTDKPNKILHGFGLGNVQAICDKYGGTFAISRKESSCEATVILPL